MSLAIAFTGPEGIVLAADSRVTLSGRVHGSLIHAAYDSATNMIPVQGQPHVGAVIYGLGVIGELEPRTVHSFLPELDVEMSGKPRLSVEHFCRRLSHFFMERWRESMPMDVPDEANLFFMIGGYDKDEPYGSTYRVVVPRHPEPVPLKVGGTFGVDWGGQTGFIERLIDGVDREAFELTKEVLDLTRDKVEELQAHLATRLATRIPYQFLPLQDCVDLATLLIETTTAMQGFVLGERGVGGPVDVSVVTRNEGFRALQEKQLHP